ncbi:ABC transporter permease, partial [Alistipes putredinis]
EGQTFASAEIDSLALTRVKGVGVVSYLLEQQVLLERDGLQTMATLRGVDDRYTEVFPIEETIPLGSWSVRTGDLDRLVLGRDMARTLGIRSLVRAEVAVYALRRGSFSSLLPVDGYSVRRLDVGGLFFLDLESENEYALTSLRAAQELFDRPGRISAISVRVADGADAEKVRREIAGIVGDDFTVRTRDEMNALFFRLVAYEKWGVFFISLLVLVLASFSVVGTLVMLMIEKRDDVATLRALGADTKLIRSIFVGEGLLIGGLGASIGAVLGVGFCLAQQHFGMIRIPVDTLLLYSYPVEMRWSDLLIVAAAFGAVILAISELTVRSVMKNNKL